MNRFTVRLVGLAYPLATAIGVLVLWYALVLGLKVPAYLLPTPGAVVQRIGEDLGFLLHHAWVTTYETIGGFVLSVVVGVPLAMLIVASRALDKALMPWLVLSQTFPKVALAPLIVVWFGLGVGPKLVVTFLVAFFPVVISSVVGLRSIERETVELARSLRATRWQMFWHFRLPLALPSIFAGLKVSVAFSVVGAVIAEWVGATQGLGYLLLQANANLDTPLLFAVLAALTVHRLDPCTTAWELAERLALPWHASSHLHELSRLTLTLGGPAHA